MFTFFRRLHWKLTISYALVTAATVILLAIFLVGLALYGESQQTTRVYDSFFWSKTAFQDNIPYLLEDSTALQAWLTRVYTSGFTRRDFTGYTVRESLDYASTIIPASIYILDPHLNLIAAAPVADPALVGKPFAPEAYAPFDVQPILKAALVGDKNYFAQSLHLPGNRYIVAFPLRKSDTDPVAAIVLYQLNPIVFATPENLQIYRMFFLGTAGLIVTISLPVGAVFGWLASRSLRKRLVTLSATTQSWSRGDFSVSPRDKSGDEIGELTRNLVSMAEQLQILLSTRNELARIEERNRLARDLHDTVKQQTYAARMQLSAAKNLLATDPATAAGHLETALQLNRETQQELKLIIDNLRPSALEDLGLAQAIREYVTRWQEHTGINVKTTITGERPLSLNAEQALYRVLQESLSNVARHSEADSVILDLNLLADRVILSLADNGRGFDPASTPAASYGLTSMKARLAEVGGTFSIEPALPNGTKVIAEVKFEDGQ